MEVEANELWQILNEMYPRELAHALSELRARKAEAQLEALLGAGEKDDPSPDLN